ncbi:MAG: hypothetical protein HQL65_14570 [Magnetococcales bacterium]|nr:hypothetical protein [Magnetococcales bacterium]
MSNPLIDLQLLLIGQKVMTGRVIDISTTGLLRVASKGGVVEVPGQASVGDIVTIENGRATKRGNGTSVQVFYV